MKRSKIFLGLTTCVLAFAAVAATKANFGGTTTGYYRYTTANSSQSKHYTANIGGQACLGASSRAKCKITTTGGAVRTLFTKAFVNHLYTLAN